MLFVHRCSECEINYPLLAGNKCPICESPLRTVDGNITTDWQARVKEHVLREEMDDHIFPTVRAKLRQEGKQYLLDTHDVVDSGINNRLEAESIIRIVDPDDSKELYVEVLGYAYQARLYLVRPFPVTWPVDSKGNAYIPKRWIKK